MREKTARLAGTLGESVPAGRATVLGPQIASIWANAPAAHGVLLLPALRAFDRAVGRLTMPAAACLLAGASRPPCNASAGLQAGGRRQAGALCPSHSRGLRSAC